MNQALILGMAFQFEILAKHAPFRKGYLQTISILLRKKGLIHEITLRKYVKL